MTPTKRLTLGELRYRKKPTLATLQQWSTEFSTNMLTSVWEGFDQLPERSSRSTRVKRKMTSNEA
jgi:hypothetical protein